jgi:hypothetical protein
MQSLLGYVTACVRSKLENIASESREREGALNAGSCPA